VEVNNVAAPAVGPGQVRVRVQAAAVNFPDVLLVAGHYQIPVAPPFVPGSELAGEVIEVADDVTSLRPGDRVFGATLVGAFAEEAAVAATSLTAVPAGVDVAAAAAFGVAHRTAYHVLRSVAAVQPGECVVVLGAGGGVGLATVQLAAHLGASVVAVASTSEKLAAAAPRRHDAGRPSLRQPPPAPQGRRVRRH
jgi:NADPH2:quinone reductase